MIVLEGVCRKPHPLKRPFEQLCLELSWLHLTQSCDLSCAFTLESLPPDALLNRKLYHDAHNN